MTWNPSIAFNELPNLPPQGFVVTPALSSHLVSARVALERLNVILETTGYANVFASVFPIVEAQASSEIENIVTTNDTLFKFLAGPGGNPDVTARKVWANRQAFQAGLEGLRNRPITANLARLVASNLLGHNVDVRTDAGTFIGNSREIRYTPPTGRENIERLLQSWEEFVNADSGLDPLIVMAMAHYQFESIHPFHDGNGRTGRILNLLLLVQNQLLDWPALNMSKHINERRSDYYALLNSVSAEGDWEGWILYMLQVVRSAATNAIDQVMQMQRMRNTASVELENRGVKNPDRLVNLLFAYPYSRQGLVQKELAVTRPTAVRMLEIARSIGLLEVQAVGRDRYYINSELMTLFA